MTTLMVTSETEQELGVPALFGTRYRPRGAEPRAATRMLAIAGTIAGDVCALLVVSRGERTMLFRYSAYGELLGRQTRHASIEAAQEEMSAEYGELALEWEELPEDVGDAHAHAVRIAYDNRSVADYGSGT